MTTDGTRIRRALENLHQAADDGLELHLTDVEAEALSRHVTELTAQQTPLTAQPDPTGENHDPVYLAILDAITDLPAEEFMLAGRVADTAAHAARRALNRQPPLGTEMVTLLAAAGNGDQDAVRAAYAAIVDQAQEQLRAELRDLTEINRVLASERDQARQQRNVLDEANRAHMTERDSSRAMGNLFSGRLDDIRALLLDADAAPGMPNPDDSIVEAVRWLVDDWRIEKAANDRDDQTQLATITKERDELAEALTNPRRQALRDALRLAPRPGPLTGPSTTDVLAIADWLLTNDQTEPQPEPEPEPIDDIPDAPTFDTNRHQ